MSLKTLFFLACCYGSYRLGVFNTCRPGEAQALLQALWMRVYRWLQKP
jgi:hypothetical protein